MVLTRKEETLYTIDMDSLIIDRWRVLCEQMLGVCFLYNMESL